jgi:RNA polymerase sigma factor (sigma-70 family)
MTIFRTRPELLDGFRAGARPVLEAIYWAYVDKVERIVRYDFHRQGGARVPGVSPADVPDLVQEVFARLFRESTRKAFDAQRELGPFLGTIARNVVTDWARKRGHKIIEVAGELDEMPQDDRGPEWPDEALIRATEDYLATLAPALKQVHEQRYVLGRSQDDAARALGITRQNLRTLDGKLRQGLKKALRKAHLDWNP